MTITVTGSDLHDVRRQVSHAGRQIAIKISWIDDQYQYWRSPPHGCIVDATGISSEDVPKSFNSNDTALAYIEDLLIAQKNLVENERKKEG